MCLLRFLAVTRPLYYRNEITCARVQKALVLGLIWPCAHLVLPVAGFGKFRLYKKGLYCALDLTPDEPRDKILLYATIVEGGVVTLALLYFCGTILCFVKRKRRVNSLLSEQQQRAAGIQKVNKQQGGFARLTFVIVVLFCVCYVPFLSYRIFILIRGPSSYSDTTYYYSELLAHINPLLNPLVYVLCNKQYRSSIKELVTKCCCKYRCRIGETLYVTDDYGRSIELRKMSAFSTRTQSITLD
ncbi:hypothetical protein OS493_013466 [Desmophyllum pertusum]|uniref:G-protein coupled receptors family 1 profile domain-containing protein n=1 Tax=Desmophyllum pertusum TaxID=174260 RepID=A0A9X0DBL9_9CNID|nr:hypothetical protein OS493_013466 [Desmophyllum pertusum]